MLLGLPLPFLSFHVLPSNRVTGRHSDRKRLPGGRGSAQARERRARG